MLVLWLFLHAALAGGLALAAGAAGLETPSPQSLVGSGIGTLWILAVIVFVVRVEMKRRSELVFLANLGHSFRQMSMVVCGECLVLEVSLRLAVG